jgi:hypothetical protein
MPSTVTSRAPTLLEMDMDLDKGWNLSTDSVEHFSRLKAGQPDPQVQVFVRGIRSLPDTVEAFRTAGATRLVLVLEPPIEPGRIAELARSAGL